jgi:hypothetical protein
MSQKLALFPRGAFVSLETLLGIRGGEVATVTPKPEAKKSAVE